MNFCRFYDILISSGREKIPENKIKKEVIQMKKEMMKLLKSYILKYNSMRADLYLDEMLGVDVKYDKGKIYELSNVVYDMASILGIELNMDIKGYIKITE